MLFDFGNNLQFTLFTLPLPLQNAGVSFCILGRVPYFGVGGKFMEGFDAAGWEIDGPARRAVASVDC